MTVPAAQGGSGPPILPASRSTPRTRITLPQTGSMPKERLFAHPNRPASFAAGGKLQVQSTAAATATALKNRFIAIYTKAAHGAKPGTPGARAAIQAAEKQTHLSPAQATKLFAAGGRPSAANRVGANSPQNVNIPTYVPQQYITWVRTAAQQTGLPASVVAAQINEESGFDPTSTSPANAQGIAQFLPSTFSQYSKGSPYNVNDAHTAYVGYMNSLLKQYHGNVRNALAAYNAGPGNLAAGYGYADTILSKAGTSRAASAGSPSTFGGTRPGGQPAPASGTGSGASSGGGSPASGSGGGSSSGGAGISAGTPQAVDQLFADYTAERDTPRATSTFSGSNPFSWWWQSFSGTYSQEING